VHSLSIQEAAFFELATGHPNTTVSAPPKFRATSLRFVIHHFSHSYSMGGGPSKKDDLKVSGGSVHDSQDRDSHQLTLFEFRSESGEIQSFPVALIGMLVGSIVAFLMRKRLMGWCRNKKKGQPPPDPGAIPMRHHVDLGNHMISPIYPQINNLPQSIYHPPENPFHYPYPPSSPPPPSEQQESTIQLISRAMDRRSMIKRRKSVIFTDSLKPAIKMDSDRGEDSELLQDEGGERDNKALQMMKRSAERGS